MTLIKNIALIDDCHHFYRYIKKKILIEFGDDVQITYFSDSDCFVEHLMNNGPDKFGLLMADRFIKSYDLFDDDFVETCKDLGFRNKIILLSKEPPSDQDQKPEYGRFDAMIRKGTISMINELRNIMRGTE